MAKKYFVVGDIGAHNGHIDSAEMEHIWTGDKPGGWTYQQITGPHGTILGEYDTREEAEEHLAKWLKCDSVEQGKYCYTHNPHP